jgi:hypothetical protein
LQEITLGKTRYYYRADEEKDYLLFNTDNGVKINISFSRNPLKNKQAKDGLKSFFNELYS